MRRRGGPSGLVTPQAPRLRPPLATARIGIKGTEPVPIYGFSRATDAPTVPEVATAAPPAASPTGRSSAAAGSALAPTVRGIWAEVAFF